jgi:hypothetical protein
VCKCWFGYGAKQCWRTWGKCSFWIMSPCTSHALHHIRWPNRVWVWLFLGTEAWDAITARISWRTVSISMHNSCFGYLWHYFTALEKWHFSTCMASQYHHGIGSMEVTEAMLSLWRPVRRNVLTVQSLHCLNIWKG